jgi:hypothetical protein
MFGTLAFLLRATCGRRTTNNTEKSPPLHACPKSMSEVGLKPDLTNFAGSNLKWVFLFFQTRNFCT